MTKSIWINLPVRDVARSRRFFEAIGFRPNPDQPASEAMASMLIGDNDLVLMLFPESTFEGFTGLPVSDTGQTSEVLFSLDAQSRDEVDAMARKVTAAGGTVFGEPAEKDGWMYGAGFTDPDGHRWNILYMDLEKIEK